MLPPMPANRRTLLLSLSVAPWAAYAGRAPADLRWVDAERQRELPLRLRLPAGDAQVPLVLFSHGLGGNLDAGTAWAEAWAAAGIATLHLQHPGSDTEALRASGPRGLRSAASVEQLQARARDVRFVLDALQRRQAEFPRLRLDAIGLAGHSFGAHTTLAVAGQFPALADARPRAFAAFSPSPPRAGGSLAELRRPVLCLTGSRDGNPLGDETSGDYRRAAFDALPAGDKAELWLDGADHATFSGHAPTRGLRGRLRAATAREQGDRHAALIAALSTDWWRAQLLGDAAARQRLATRPDGLLPPDDWRRA